MLEETKKFSEIIDEVYENGYREVELIFKVSEWNKVSKYLLTMPNFQKLLMEKIDDTDASLKYFNNELTGAQRECIKEFCKMMKKLADLSGHSLGDIEMKLIEFVGKI